MMTWIICVLGLLELFFAVCNSSEICPVRDSMTKEQMNKKLNCQAWKDKALEAHNKIRKEVHAGNMIKMEWDPQLAKTALGYAMTCQPGHSTFGYRKLKLHLTKTHYWVGENGWAGTATGDDFVNGFHREKDNYDLNNFKCNKDFKYCGHYTQIINAKTIAVGCGRAVCPTKTKKYMRRIWCWYRGGGNAPNLKPFKVGGECEFCPENTVCKHGFCELTESPKKFLKDAKNRNRNIKRLLRKFLLTKS